MLPVGLFEPCPSEAPGHRNLLRVANIVPRSRGMNIEVRHSCAMADKASVPPVCAGQKEAAWEDSERAGSIFHNGREPLNRS